MENVRAKFLCIEVKKYLGGTYDLSGKYVPGTLYNYRFSVVSGTSEENKRFFASTPSGHIELNSVRDDLFELGREYYIDFSLYTPAPTVIESE